MFRFFSLDNIRSHFKEVVFYCLIVGVVYLYYAYRSEVSTNRKLILEQLKAAEERERAKEQRIEQLYEQQVKLINDQEELRKRLQDTTQKTSDKAQ